MPRGKKTPNESETSGTLHSVKESIPSEGVES